MISLQTCVRCGHILFPARKLCHRCGGAAWVAMACDRGVIEETTTVHQRKADASPIHLAHVRTPQGVSVIARTGRPLAPGEGVALHESDDGALWAEAFSNFTPLA